MFQKQHESRTRGALFRDEMAQTVNHAMRAAGHAAGGVRAAGTQMAPAAGRFRSAAALRWTEFSDAAGRMPRRAERERRQAKRRRGLPRMGLLVMSGASVGMIAAMLRRRRRQQWEGYDPTRMMEPVGQEEGVGLEEPAAEAGMPEPGRMPGAEPGTAGETLRGQTGTRPPM